MAFLDRVRGLFSTKMTGEQLDAFREIYGGRSSQSGPSVTVKTSLQVTTVLACCRVIADGLAQVPWKLFKPESGGRIEVADHPLSELLRLAPNAHQTSFEFRETMAFHIALAGNAFAFVNRVGSARRITEMVLIEPGRVEIKRDDDGRIVSYVVSNPRGERKAFLPEMIWHIRGPSWDSQIGLDMLAMTREAIGLSLALETTHAKFHANGAKVPGAVIFKGNLSPEKYEQRRKWLARFALTGTSTFEPMILDGDADYKQMGMTGVDAEHLATRNHQVEEICRAMRVLPIMVGYADKTATYASAEQMFLAHVVHTLMPWYRRLENSADLFLLSEKDRKDGIYTRFIPNALMRGAAKDRSEFYAKALGGNGIPGYMTPNEVRALEDMNPLASGAELYAPPPVTAAPPPKAT